MIDLVKKLFVVSIFWILIISMITFYLFMEIKQ